MQIYKKRNGQIMTSFNIVMPLATFLLCSHIHHSQYPKVNLLHIFLIMMRPSASVVSLKFLVVNTFALHQVTWTIMVQMFMRIPPSLLVLFDALPNALDVMLDI